MDDDDHDDDNDDDIGDELQDCEQKLGHVECRRGILHAAHGRKVSLLRRIKVSHLVETSVEEIIEPASSVKPDSYSTCRL